MNTPEIILENNFFIAINKPSGLLSVPDRKQSEPSLKDYLLAKYSSIYTVHRLDKDTSGIIVFAKDAETHKALSQLFESREVEKFYVGLVHGSLLQENGNIAAPIMQQSANSTTMVIHKKGKPSYTEYTLLEKFKYYSWVQFQIHTGRTHQIRIHCQYLGNSIVCDPIYGDEKPILLSTLKKKFKLSKLADEEKPLLNRLALHSHQLNFSFNNQLYQLEAPIPKDLRAMLQQLRKNC